jgi:hypothetical protein
VLRPERDNNASLPSPSMSMSMAPPSQVDDSHQFQESFTYTLPAGWTFGDADRGWLRLDATTDVAPGTTFYALMNVRATRPDCSNQLRQSVGASSHAITTWLSQDPALDASAPRPITLPGASGSYVDLKLARGWDQTCKEGLPLVSNPKGGEGWGVEHNKGQMRLYVLDLPDGNTVTIVVDVRHASDFKDVIHHAAPVVESFDFSA